MKRVLPAIAVILWTSLALTSLAMGSQIPLRVDTRCPDKSLEYTVNSYVIGEVSKAKTYKLVSDDSAQLHIRIIIAPARQKSLKPTPPLGVGFAMLVTKKRAEQWDIVTFSNVFVPLDDIEDEVRRRVKDAIGK